MNLPSKLRFIIINNLTEDAVKKSDYVVYALACSEGVYVGMSSDPVKRRQEVQLGTNRI
jgi:predicted GIY-YIG superfamily endonuclease